LSSRLSTINVQQCVVISIEVCRNIEGLETLMASSQTVTESMPSSAERAVLDQATIQLYIGGRCVDSTDRATFEVVDPSRGQPLCSVADASVADGRSALDAAVAAQPSFAATTPRERSDILMRAFELLHDRIDDLALLMTLEMGKPLAESRGEISYAAEFVRHFAGEAVRIDG